MNSLVILLISVFITAAEKGHNFLNYPCQHASFHVCAPVCEADSAPVYHLTCPMGFTCCSQIPVQAKQRVFTKYNTGISYDQLLQPVSGESGLRSPTLKEDNPLNSTKSSPKRATNKFLKNGSNKARNPRNKSLRKLIRQLASGADTTAAPRNKAKEEVEKLSLNHPSNKKTRNSVKKSYKHRKMQQENIKPDQKNKPTIFNKAVKTNHPLGKKVRKSVKKSVRIFKRVNGTTKVPPKTKGTTKKIPSKCNTTPKPTTTLRIPKAEPRKVGKARSARAKGWMASHVSAAQLRAWEAWRSQLKEIDRADHRSAN